MLPEQLPWLQEAGRIAAAAAVEAAVVEEAPPAEGERAWSWPQAQPERDAVMNSQVATKSNSYWFTQKSSCV